MIRKDITDENMEKAINQVRVWLGKRLEQKGHGSFSSTHEIRGMLDDEFNELKEALHGRDLDDIYWELRDIAVGCVFAMACIKQGDMDW